MSRALKFAGIGLGSLIGLLALLVVVVVFLVDPNDYKAEIATVVKDKTDMDLVLTDRLEWALWPSIGVKLGKTTLTDPVAKEQLLAVDKASVSVQVMPLFAKQIAIDAVNLDGAKVRFIQHADGSTSWDRMLAKLKSPEEEESQKVKFKVKSLDVKNTEIFALDEASKTTRTIKDVAVQASNIDPDETFPIAAQFLLTQQDGAGKTLIAKNTIKTQVRMYQDEERYVLSGLEASSKLSGSLLPAPADIKLAAEGVTADLKAQQHKVEKLQFEAEYKDPALASPATVKLAGNVLADLKQQTVTVSGLNADASYPAKDLASPATAKVSGAVVADLKQQLVNVTGLTLDASYPAKNLKSPATVKLSGNVVADLGKTVLNVNGLKAQVSYPDAARPAPISAALATDVQAQWTEGSVALPNLALNAVYPDKAFPKALAVSLNSSVNGNWKQGQFSLPQFVAKTLGVEARGQLAARLPALAAGAKPGTPVTSGMTLNGALATNTFNPRALMAALAITPPKTQDPKALNSASVKADIVGSENSILLKNLRVLLDGSTLTGEAGISDLKSGRQYARLSLDKINVDSYLPPSSAAAAAPAAGAAKPAAGGILPVDLLRQQNLDVVLSVGSLTAMSYNVSNFRAAATAGKGVLNISELKGGVYNGSFSIPGSINVQGAQPVLAFTPNINQVELGPLLQKLLKKDLFTGKANYNGELRLTGNTTDAWLRALNGSSGLKLQDGMLRGVNLMQLVMNEMGKYQSLLPLLTGKDSATIVSKQNDTPIRDMSTEASISNGTVNSKNFNADLNKAQMKGEGNFNLVTQEVDYRFTMNLDKSVFGEKYAAYPIPIRCHGSIKGNMASLCGVDSRAVREMALKAVANQQLEKLGVKGGDVKAAVDEKKKEAEAKVQQKVDEEKKKAQEKVNQKLNEGLNKLFGR